MQKSSAKLGTSAFCENNCDLQSKCFFSSTEKKNASIDSMGKVFFPILASSLSLSLISFYLNRLIFINKLKINVISLLGLGLTTRKITGKFVETVKRKKQ